MSLFLKDHIAQKRAEKLAKAKSVFIDKVHWSDLRTRLDLFNIEGDYPEDYLHIQWTILRLAYLSQGGTSWSKFKNRVGRANLDDIKSNVYLHINWNTLRQFAEEMGVV